MMVVVKSKLEEEEFNKFNNGTYNMSKLYKIGMDEEYSKTKNMKKR